MGRLSQRAPSIENAGQHDEFWIISNERAYIQKRQTIVSIRALDNHRVCHTRLERRQHLLKGLMEKPFLEASKLWCISLFVRSYYTILAKELMSTNSIVESYQLAKLSSLIGQRRSYRSVSHDCVSFQ
jgi:hypothetical protein